MKHTKLLVVALLVALIACLAMTASADECLHPTRTQLILLKPTCTTNGVGVYQCLTCGKQLDSFNIPATGVHTWGAPETVAADCGNDGYVKRTCTVCGYTDVYQTIPATGNHTWGTYASAVPPTCTTNGTKEWKKCTVCGKLKTPAPEVWVAPGHDTDGQPWDVIIQEPTCIAEGILGRKCKVCGAVVETKTAPKGNHDAGWYSYVKTTATLGGGYTLPYKAATCTTAGCTAVYQCSICGALKGGETIPANGHKLNGVEWTVKTGATCAVDGILVRKCSVCGQEVEKQNVGKGKHDAGWYTYNKDTATAGSGYILAAKPKTCTVDGCTAVYQCSQCGATKGGEVVKAYGHQIDTWTWKDGKETDCTYTGTRLGHCSVCGQADAQSVVVPAYGHSAVWQIEKVPTPTEVGNAILKCTRCNKTIGMQILYYGDKLPSGAVNTGAAATSTAKSASTKTSTAKSASTKTSTAKTTSTKSASTSASTKTAAAPATTETKKVATVAAVAAPAAELEANQAQLVADKHLYVVKNVAGEEIVLTVNVADGKITVEAALAEGESLVLYANAEAIENPTAENTLVLTANEAVELPEAFANAIVAVVKTESLPTAVAAK